ncbi:MAG TPA: nucleotide exchange factor GrpE [Candidatus Cloacimonadota bacterium]|nr:nucleotide exchange factor GrpE [Candidatus Cloacimonadota bacterium]HQL14348.1 nucleotide exchange factor GrpE [Candidatus Cloacimonadota bacterium]
MAKKKNKEDFLEQELEQTLEEEAAEAEEELETAAETAPEQENLQSKVKELEAGVADWKDKYLRSMAEFDNYRKRSNEEKADWVKFASEKLALAVCEVWDNFDRALQQLTEEQKKDKFVQGIILIEQQLKSALEREGIKRIDALGKDFDPKLHEALVHIPSDEYEEGKVAAIIQNGYMMHDKVIRPVRVAVSGGKAENKEEEE